MSQRPSRERLLPPLNMEDLPPREPTDDQLPIGDFWNDRRSREHKLSLYLFLGLVHFESAAHKGATYEHIRGRYLHMKERLNETASGFNLYLPQSEGIYRSVLYLSEECSPFLLKKLATDPPKYSLTTWGRGLYEEHKHHFGRYIPNWQRYLIEHIPER